MHFATSRLPQRRSPNHSAHRGAWPWGDVLGLAWVVMALAAYLSPALWDGFSFGPTDIANQLSFLTYVPHLAVHNGLNGDIITQAVPWNTLDWVAVHHGQLPLWNNYSGDGMPLMLNFESAPLALPTLVGYLSRWPARSSWASPLPFSLPAPVPTSRPAWPALGRWAQLWQGQRSCSPARSAGGPAGP